MNKYNKRPIKQNVAAMVSAGEEAKRPEGKSFQPVPATRT